MKLSSLLVPLSKSHKLTPNELLIQHGFINQSSSGVFELLPLSLRIQNKITSIIRKHLTNAHCTELQLPVLVNPQIWETSGRLKTGNEFLFTLDKKFLLAPTAEEQITKLVGQRSYKHLPLNLYQITRKFRNELRPRGGLLRTKEFLMKDLYTFDADLESAIENYKQIQKAYDLIFSEIGLNFKKVLADSGEMGGSQSHEYHVLSINGEDMIGECLCGFKANSEVTNECPQCKTKLSFQNAIEIGHTFLLGDRYSKPFKAFVSTKQGSLEPMQMGCFGIGVSRIIASIAETMSDEFGLVWPKSVAPFQCVVVGKQIEKVKQVSKLLNSASIESCYDDRTRQVGLSMRLGREMGFPYTVVVGDDLEVLPRKGTPFKCDLDTLVECVGKV